MNIVLSEDKWPNGGRKYIAEKELEGVCSLSRDAYRRLMLVMNLVDWAVEIGVMQSFVTVMESEIFNHHAKEDLSEHLVGAW